MGKRDDLKRMIDDLPEADVGSVIDVVEVLHGKQARGVLDVGVAALDAAPVDDEPDTEQERLEAREAWEQYQREGGISSQEARRRLLG